MDDEELAFTDLDLEAVRIFQGLQALGTADVETAVQMARVIGSSMARIAEAELVPSDVAHAEVDPVLSAEAFASVADVTIPAMAKLLEFVWRRQVAAGIQRSMMLRSHGLAPGESPVLAVGFADMVGFTLLSQHLSHEELAEVVRRFEEISHDIVTTRPRPCRQDDRRRGHVRRRQRGRRGTASDSTSPTRTPTTTCSPTSGSAWPAARSCFETATTSVPRSTWPTASSTSAIRGRS